MCNVRYGVSAALLLSFVSTVGYAQKGIGHGAGLYSCGKYLSAAHNQAPGGYRNFTGPEGEQLVTLHGLYLEWLLGFITATNFSMSAGTGNNIQTDAPAIDVWVRKWCEQNPTRTIADAAW